MKALFTVVALTTLGQVVQAAELFTPPATAPLALTDEQMDRVRGGGLGSSNVNALGSAGTSMTDTVETSTATSTSDTTEQ
jgi:hypothetical protein